MLLSHFYEARSPVENMQREGVTSVSAVDILRGMAPPHHERQSVAYGRYCRVALGLS